MLAPLFCCLLAGAQGQTPTLKTFKLGETTVKVNVYERAGAAVTFFSPHHNERGGRELAKELVNTRGGRFVEVEALDDAGAPARRLRFRVGGKSYGVDPNRIYTAQGRGCLKLPTEAEAAVKAFADELLALLFAPGGRLRAGESVFVAVHNNADVEERAEAERDADLTALGFLRPLRSRGFLRGEFAESAAGVYLSNAEEDEDNFILVTEPQLVSHFAGRGFNVVLQKPAAQLRDGKCSVDDGSLSVYAAYSNISYVNLEADAAGGAARQRRMFQAVYELIAQPPTPRP
jgi:nucleotide-binding universal stress UspA family protein